MKLLIVDDENLTRTGLKNSISWIELGIEEVLLASDGQEGLRMAFAYKPEIVMSDVRMPHMTGIDMMEHILKVLPDTIFIFMSGYSDKEYLKAAIRLRAVDYVEKPLDYEEVKKAVVDAINRHRKLEKQNQAQNISDTVSASQFAISLTLPYSSHREMVDRLCQIYCEKYGSSDLFHSAFTVLLQLDSRSEIVPMFLSDFEAQLHDYVRGLHMHVIAAEKKTGVFVFHFFRKVSFTKRMTVPILTFMSDYLKKTGRLFYLSCGLVVTGITKLYNSYSSAVIELQHSFFLPPGSTVVAQNSDQVTAAGSTGRYLKISDALIRELQVGDLSNMKKAALLCDELSAAVLEEAPALISKNIQGLYYRMISIVVRQAASKQLTMDGFPSDEGLLMDKVWQCFSYRELHELLLDRIRTYTAALQNFVPENSTVYLMKQYIHAQYKNPLLSTKEIADAASLSPSYACTVFKEETGQTLNQYLTEFRLEQAKNLLKDPRINIMEIAEQVGYSNSNYFGKAFKKYTGMSPSEFRERKTE